MDDCMIDDSFEKNYAYASGFHSISYDIGEEIFMDIKKKSEHIIESEFDYSYKDVCYVLEGVSDSIRSSFDMNTLILSALLFLELRDKCELRHGPSFLVSFDASKRSYMMELLLILRELNMRSKYESVLVTIESIRSKMKEILKK